MMEVDRMMRQRRLTAYGLVVFGLPLLTAILLHAHSRSLQDAVLLYLLGAVLIGALGGVRPAVLGTAASLIALDWYFIPPFHQLSVSSTGDVITLITFVATTVIVSIIVEQSLRRARDAERARVAVDEAETLARTNDLRAAILSAVSHDLRTPLASIKTASSTLLADTQLERSGGERRLLTTIDRSVDRLDAMVQNLLDASRVRTGAIEVRTSEISIAELVTSVLEGIPDAPSRVLLDLPDSLPLVRVDPVLTERVLTNVTENAMTFSTGAVRIEATSTGDAVDLRVIDSGPGIPKEERERVLLPFQRLEDSTNGRRVGLGLAVAKGFIDAMNGSLSIDDSPGGGTTIDIELPAVRS